MDGYKITADSYRQYLEQTEDIPAEIREDLQGKIRIYEILAGLTPQERREIFNSGAFNDVVRGYVRMAIDNTDTPAEIGGAIMQELPRLFDTVTAEQAQAYLSGQ